MTLVMLVGVSIGRFVKHTNGFLRLADKLGLNYIVMNLNFL